jgi:hypothetical protein
MPEGWYTKSRLEPGVFEPFQRVWKGWFYCVKQSSGFAEIHTEIDCV